MANKKSKGDIYWYLPNKKRPIAYSTVAASETVEVFSRKYRTVQDVYNALYYPFPEKEILKLYIDAGYGDAIASELFC